MPVFLGQTNVKRVLDIFFQPDRLPQIDRSCRQLIREAGDSDLPPEPPGRDNELFPLVAEARQSGTADDRRLERSET
jgi:hypothetical protein